MEGVGVVIGDKSVCQSSLAPLFPQGRSMVRTEEEILKDLAQMCATDGYAHVVAYFCFRDNAVVIDSEGKLTAKDLEHQSSLERLVRTEISTLIGLMCKAEINLEIPTPDKMQGLIVSTEAPLEELPDDDRS